MNHQASLPFLTLAPVLSGTRQHRATYLHGQHELVTLFQMLGGKWDPLASPTPGAR